MVLGSLKVPNGQLRIMSGKTRPQRYSVVPPSNDDANDLSHDAAGLLSVRRGGGALPMWEGSGLGFDTPRQRQVKLRAASNLGQPRPASAEML